MHGPVRVAGGDTPCLEDSVRSRLLPRARAPAAGLEARWAMDDGRSWTMLISNRLFFPINLDSRMILAAACLRCGAHY